jgi:hypothetical protein
MILRGHETDFEHQCRAEGYLIRTRTVDAKYEELRVDVAKSLFALNRRMMRRDPETVALRYVGIGAHVYSCMLSPP